MALGLIPKILSPVDVVLFVIARAALALKSHDNPKFKLSRTAPKPYVTFLENAMHIHNVTV